MSLTPASGFLVQTQAGDAKHGNFEVVVPDLIRGGLSHYWRNNGGNGQWVLPRAPVGTARYTSTSIAESDYKRVPGNEQGNLELLARQEEPAGDRLDFAWRDNGGDWAWNGPFEAKLPHGVAAPALVAERADNPPGPLRAVVPMESGGFAEFERVGGSWVQVARVDGDVLQGVSFLLSFVRSEAWPSERDEYGDRVVAAVAANGTLQLYVRYGSLAPSPRTWKGPYRFGEHILPAQFGNVFRGRPSIIMSSFNQNVSADPPVIGVDKVRYGNYELVVPMQPTGIAHMYKDNDVLQGPGNDPWANWSSYTTFGRGQYDEVSLIQSNYGDEHGHLEVAARRRDMVGFDFYWRDDDLTTWHGPNYIR
jgi:hypothetical protein